MTVIVADRQKSLDALSVIEREKALLSDQVQQMTQQIATTNAAVTAAAEREAQLKSDIQKLIADGTDAAAAVKVLHDQELTKLRSEIAADPAPDQKCSCFQFLTLC